MPSFAFVQVFATSGNHRFFKILNSIQCDCIEVENLMLYESKKQKESRKEKEIYSSALHNASRRPIGGPLKSHRWALESNLSPDPGVKLSTYTPLVFKTSPGVL